MTQFEMAEIMREIYRICHIPSGSRHAYTHFQQDFDRIRELTRPFTHGERVAGEKNEQ